MKRIALAAVLLLLTSTASAAPVNYSLGQWGQLGLELPPGWTAGPQGKDAPGGAAFRITPGGGEPLVLLMTPIPAPGKADELVDAAQKAAEEAKARLAKDAVEGELAVRELEGSECLAYYVSATDKSVEKPSATSFKYVDQGAAAVGRLMVSFTVLSNIADGGARAQAMEVVRTARHVKAGAPWITPAGGAAVAYPGKAWKVALDLPGFAVEPYQLTNAGKGVKLVGRNAATRMIVTVLLEEAHAGATAVEQREEDWKKMIAGEPLTREDVTRSERGPMAILEMRVPTYWGRTVNQKSVYAYLVRDGVAVDVHLSKVGYQESDKELLEKVIGSVRVVE